LLIHKCGYNGSGAGYSNAALYALTGLS